jgi:hypothetical protein
MMEPDNGVRQDLSKGVALAKKALSAILQAVLFSFVYAVGVVLPALNIIPSHITTWASGTKFEWDGVFLVLALLVLILLIEALRKRLRSAAPWTMLAMLLAAIGELIVRFGVMTPDR